MSGSFEPSAGNRARAGLEPSEQKSDGENALPAGRSADGEAGGRVDVGTVLNAATLGELARAAISRSRHGGWRLLAEAVLSLLGPGRVDK